MQDSAAGPSAKSEAHLPEVDVNLTTLWYLCLSCSCVLTVGGVFQRHCYIRYIFLVGSFASCLPSSLMEALPPPPPPPAKEANLVDWLVRQVRHVKTFSMEDGGTGSVPSDPKAGDAWSTLG